MKKYNKINDLFWGGGIACINAGGKDNSFRCLMTRLSETGGRVFLYLNNKGVKNEWTSITTTWLGGLTMANLITIDQLLESVDLEFEPRFVTKDKNCEIWIWNSEPVKDCNWHIQRNAPREFYGLFITNKIKLSEFDGKDWTECIYEVPQKTTGKIKLRTGSLER